jgi:hypothetical protein
VGYANVQMQCHSRIGEDVCSRKRGRQGTAGYVIVTAPRSSHVGLRYILVTMDDDLEKLDMIDVS